MRISDVDRYAFGACVVAMLAGCEGRSGALLSPLPAGISAEQTRPPGSYAVLYNFAGGSEDGALPEAPIVALNGVLYGTTFNGGSTTSCSSGCGTVFKISTSGRESILRSFTGSPKDGANPEGGMVALNGTLYGITATGGSSTNCSSGCGAVFKISPSGRELILHNFTGAPKDGATPYGGLVAVNGMLYGTTYYGGSGTNCASAGCGTVFRISTSGRESILHSFTGNPKDGANPLGGMVALNGVIYGTTVTGGSSANCSFGCGTVFKITTSGRESILHSFAANPKDGANAFGGLIALNGVLYGTTYTGGSSANCYFGCGTVFKITTSGRESILHSFTGSPKDGANAFGGLVARSGLLYGTTYAGGSSTSCSSGCGTLFKIGTSGGESILRSFTGSPKDGANPEAGLVVLNEVLYGTTASGGSSSNCSSGCGTVFSATP